MIDPVITTVVVTAETNSAPACDRVSAIMAIAVTVGSVGVLVAIGFCAFGG